MKTAKRVVISILLIGAFFALTYVEMPYNILLSIGLAVILLLKKLNEGKQFIQRSCTGEVSLFKLPKWPTIAYGLIAMIYTVQNFFLRKARYDFPLMLIFWTFAISHLILYFWYKRARPASITLQGTELIHNEQDCLRKDIRDLLKIKLSISGSRVILLFSDKSKISISENDYSHTDISEFIRRIVEKSGQKVDIEVDLARRLNSR